MDTEVLKPTDLTGQVIGNYHIISRLGRGGMADVYKALHTELKVHRAIKFIRPEFVTSEDFRARFQKEAQAVAQLEHPNIVRIHDFGSANNQYYMVMQFIDGLDVKNKLAAEGTIDSDRAIDLVASIAGALSYAHERDLIHRDIKPDNIMLDEKGTPILMDFGIAKLLTESTALTQTGAGIGTPAYMAPEQSQGQTITPATDIYALTVVLYELVTGSKPYNADTPIAVMLKAISDPLPLPREINPSISEELQAVILKGTAKDPLQRYQSASELADDLRSVRQGTQPTIARTAPVSTVIANSGAAAPTPTKTAVVANKVARGLTWLGALTLLGALGALWWWWNNSNESTGDTSVSTSPETAAAQTLAPQSDATGSTKQDAANLPSPGAPSGAPKSTRVAGNPRTAAQSIAATGATSAPSAGEMFSFRDTLGKGQLLENSIDLVEGDQVYLRIHKATEYTDFSLLPPGSDKPLFKSYRDAGPIEIKQTGTHRLSAAVRNGAEAEIDAQLFRINPGTLPGGSISFGDYHSAAIEWPGQRFNYQAELAAGDVVYFELVNSESYVDFSLRSADDRKDIFKSYRSAGPYEIPRSGTHQFYADPRAATLGGYEFILHKLEPAVIDGGTYEPNAFAAAETTQPGQKVSYNVDLAAGDVVFFDLSESTTYVDFELTEPGGRKTVFKHYTDKGPFELTRSGTYQLTADPRDAKLASYEFRLHKLAPGIIDGGLIAHNELVSGTTRQPGQVAHYTLTLTEPARVGLQRVDNANGYIDFTLRSADGRSDVFKSHRKVDAQLLQPGTYKFIVDPRAKGTGDYEFVMQVQPDAG